MLKQPTSAYLQTSAALAAIAAGEAQAVMKALYVECMPRFVGWASRRFKSCEEDLPDVFQEVLVAFYLRATQSNAPPIQTEKLPAFLFGIGFNKLVRLGKQRRFLLFKDDIDKLIATDADIMSFPWEETPTFETSALVGMVNALSPQCCEMLTRTLLHGQDVATAGAAMGYKDTAGASVSKSRCLKKLKADLRERFGIEAIANWFK